MKKRIITASSDCIINLPLKLSKSRNDTMDRPKFSHGPTKSIAALPMIQFPSNLNKIPVKKNRRKIMVSM
jgi:hypothetical protein